MQLFCIESVRCAVQNIADHGRISPGQGGSIEVSECLLRDLSAMGGWSGLVQANILVQLFAFGYGHPSTLASTYATLHGLSLDRFLRFSIVVKVLLKQRHGQVFYDSVMYLHDDELRAHPSAGLLFAQNVISFELETHTKADELTEVLGYHDLIYWYGEEVIRATFGEAIHDLYKD